MSMTMPVVYCAMSIGVTCAVSCTDAIGREVVANMTPRVTKSTESCRCVNEVPLYARGDSHSLFGEMNIAC